MNQPQAHTSLPPPPSAPEPLLELIDLAAERAAAKSAARLRARRSALSVVRELEARLHAALDGHRLNLPDLLPSAAVSFHAVRVRGRYPADALSVDGRPILVLAADGRLYMAWRVVGAPGTPPVAAYALARDEDINAEDLGAILRRIHDALTEHTVRAGRGETRYLAVADLATRVRRALDTDG